jgi:hypothetical protein
MTIFLLSLNQTQQNFIKVFYIKFLIVTLPEHKINLDIFKNEDLLNRRIKDLEVLNNVSCGSYLKDFPDFFDI